MKITNTTSYPDYLLRCLVGWCCRELGLPAKAVRQADYRNRTYGHAVNGRAWYRSRILVRVGPDRDYPYSWPNHRGVDLLFSDQLAAIVYVTGHELQHLKNWHDGSDADLRQNRDMEPHCVRAGNRLMKAFEVRRAELLDAWGREPARCAADRGPRDVVSERAAKAAADLLRWEKKLKLAKTKVAKYRRRVAYYAKKSPG